MKRENNHVVAYMGRTKVHYTKQTCFTILNNIFDNYNSIETSTRSMYLIYVKKLLRFYGILLEDVLMYKTIINNNTTNVDKSLNLAIFNSFGKMFEIELYTDYEFNSKIYRFEVLVNHKEITL